MKGKRDLALNSTAETMKGKSMAECCSTPRRPASSSSWVFLLPPSPPSFIYAPFLPPFLSRWEYAKDAFIYSDCLCTLHTHSQVACARAVEKSMKNCTAAERTEEEEGEEDAARRPLFTLRDGLNVVRPCLGYPDDNLSLLNLCGDNLSGGLTFF